MDPVMIKLYYKGTINNFVYKYYLDNRNYFNNIKTPNDLANTFIPGEKEWAGLGFLCQKRYHRSFGDHCKREERCIKTHADINGQADLAHRRFFEVNNLNEVSNGKYDVTVQKALNGV
jgi:hypothetical protein